MGVIVIVVRGSWAIPASLAELFLGGVSQPFSNTKFSLGGEHVLQVNNVLLVLATVLSETLQLLAELAYFPFKIMGRMGHLPGWWPMSSPACSLSRRRMGIVVITIWRWAALSFGGSRRHAGGVPVSRDL